MLRRALLSLLPALLLLLSLLQSGIPAHGAADGQATVRATDVGPGAVHKGALRDDVDFVQKQWGDEDNTPDPVDRPGAAEVWASVLTSADVPYVAEAIRPTHRACAAAARAPPAA
jgi:hypothetical protein